MKIIQIIFILTLPVKRKGEKMIKQLKIQGFRGFGEEQTIKFSLPDYINEGSGLSISVGANNSGKSTIIEAIKAFNTECTFSEGKRNIKTNKKVYLEIHNENDVIYCIKTVSSGGSEVENRDSQGYLNFYVLPSRRFVDYEFGKNKYTRLDYIRSNYFSNRTSTLSSFSSRLFHMMDNKDKINELFQSIIGQNIDWTIDQHDSGNYYVKFTFDLNSHSSEGVGDGLWSILTICDALYDSTKDSVIVIDEPELSLHPAYQKRVMEMILEFSKDRQIIISTHSPYFVNWNAISKGGGLIRTKKLTNGDIKVNYLSNETKEKIKGFLTDLNNPHVLGLEANEVFFLEENIIVTEGQEDVIIFKKLSNKKLKGNFFGWGAGGAHKEKTILTILNDLGYEKVVAVFDGDQADEYNEVLKQFPNYKFIILPQDDIRDKRIKEKIVDGIVNSKSELKKDYEVWFESDFISVINNYF